MNSVLWVVAVLMILIGVIGAVLPALPGVLFVFGGITLAAWLGGFSEISAWTIVICGVLTVLSIAIDLVAQFLFAKRAGASKLGLIGVTLGTLAGVFSGLIGIIFFPLIGAAAGEYLAHRNALRAGQVGVATWFGLFLGAILKLTIVFAMVGLFVLAMLF